MAKEFQTSTGERDRPRWQPGFGQIFPQATTIDHGHHFQFDDDPNAYGAAIRTWWAEKVAIPASSANS